MYDKIKVTGIVVSAMPVGELDRRITILTKERGKISAFARGARKPTSVLLACTQVFAYGEFVLYEGRDSYNLESADIKDYFGNIRNDMDAIWYGMYFAEFAAYMSREGVEPGGILNLLYCAFRALERGDMPFKLIRRVFELRYLTEDGEMPEVHECLRCHKKDLLELPYVWFDAEHGGIVCNSCTPSMRAHRISRSTVYSLQFIVATPLAKLFSFTVTDQVQEELDLLCRDFLSVRVGHTMKSEEMLVE